MTNTNTCKKERMNKLNGIISKTTKFNKLLKKATLKYPTAAFDEALYDYVNQMAGYDLLVIDDFGLMELDMDKCRDLFEIIETRDSKKPTMIVSQLPVAKWWDLFKDNTYADACLSRMTAKAYRLECNGRDMRKS